MIPDSANSVRIFAQNTPNWKTELANAIQDPKELLEILQLENHPELLEQALKANELFPLKVPFDYVDRMEKGNPNDPLLLQILPLNAEFRTETGFIADPVGDLKAMPTPGLLHKYHGRALLITTQLCAIHCRYCFRREFPYKQAHSAQDQWQIALNYLQQDDSIEEIILSGGDPLSLSDERLEMLIKKLETIPHLSTLRLHTRLPIVLPSRITPTLLKKLTETRLKVVIVVHANHANEISQSVKMALQKLYNGGVTLLNQAVLLKQINDSAETQIALYRTLFKANVLPYYLHMLDRVAGASHFEIPEKAALSIMQEIRNKLPGYLVPKLVREIAGESAKSPIFDSLN